ncbi:putative uncharacterized protein [Tetragenococcus halophilus subsp. halophilus]|uniref:hypothetical protein n=1 Tax=Tetragenococcus halophilus TaxID=51669 RepID=UPI000CC59E13|nr:hypothetical protein [Tetragenococcus halophilus]GBD73873.1 putative uncharacterized protein [Tetragenococcus halophilus subsp. halophilus]GBD76293.1 putative uncharacterized protein [Tetragenococcus halophilus subsp. halophilus]
MTQQSKINFILMINPKLASVVEAMEDHQIERFYEEAQKELDKELDEATFA